ALDRDPAFARAYAGLSDAWIGTAGALDSEPKAEAYTRARQAAEAALILDAGLPGAHASLGTVFFEHEWDWPRAEEHFRLGCPPDSCSPENAPRYAAFLTAVGRDAEARTVLQVSLARDPTSAAARLALARTHYLARRYDDALVELERARELTPGDAAIRRLELDILITSGRDDEALAVLRVWMATLEGAPDPPTDEGPAFAAFADWAELHRDATGASAAWLASLAARAGHKSRALSWLHQAFAERDDDLLWIHRHPAFDPLRTDATFVELLQRLGLPEPR
ncbi:MAG: tetratricopeptide repeat protein, partial [Holophagales bacterium]|nr:tetratricopeptide repeat protein [Holophagales bacterium]